MRKLLFLAMVFVVTISSTMAQKTVTGTVTDDTGTPLPGLPLWLRAQPLAQ